MYRFDLGSDGQYLLNGNESFVITDWNNPGQHGDIYLQHNGYDVSSWQLVGSDSGGFFTQLVTMEIMSWMKRPGKLVYINSQIAPLI